MKNALVLEDHNIMQVIFSELLEQAFPAISTNIANNVKSSLVLSKAITYDIALVDLSLPDGSGIELIKYLKQYQANCYIVVITIFDDDDHLIQALEAGSDGYLLKDQSKEKLISALVGISVGEPPLSPLIARKLITMFNTREPIPADCCLSEREQSVLTLIAKGNKRSDAAKQLNITENTVAAHIKSIYKKLNISSRAEATIEAGKLGLLGNALTYTRK